MCENCVKGNAPAPVLETPYGRISSLICFDMDFPSFTRNAGKTGIDLMFNPSSDWKDIDPMHTRMIEYRAIENGFSLVRIAAKGLSAAVDHQGRVLSKVDYFTTKDQPMISYIPDRGVRTIYSQAGDFTAWLSILGLVFTVFLTLKKKVGLSISSSN
jgi:apolipoprotein N-acyltransferase